MPKRPRVEMGVLITKDDRALLFKRVNAYGDPIWSTLTGHLKYGELLEERAIQEM